MDATIIAGSLNDKELKSSIDDLVSYVDKKIGSMATNFDNELKRMKESLKNLGDIKVDSGGASDAGSSRRTKRNSEEAKSVRETTVAYDQLSAATQKAMQPKNAEESFNVFIQNYREHAAKLANEIKNMPSMTTDRQLAEYKRYEDELKALKTLLADYKKELNDIYKNPNASRLEKQSALTNIEETKRLIKQIEAEQILSVQRISREDNAAMEAKKRRLEELKKIIHDLTIEEKNQSIGSSNKFVATTNTQQIEATTQELKKQKEEKANTIAVLREEIATLKAERESMEQNTPTLKAQNNIIAEKEQLLKKELMSEKQLTEELKKQEEALERRKAKDLKKQQASYTYDWNKANTMSSKSLDDTERKLQSLRQEQEKMKKSGLFDQVQLNKNQQAIDKLEQKIEELRAKKPKTMQEVLGMDESSVDAIAKKMAALKKVTVDPQNTAQVKQLGNEYQRLKRLQAELMGQNIQMTHSNNYLAQSFGYIRNRIVYALTLGAVTNFTKQIYEVRGQYELLERSLGILIDNMRRGSEIFNELNAMALKSPFTLMELATGAKQLMAYNFAEDEVVETTRRLADISSALGVPMERLVYNLGQIRAQTVLTARDARDFANAGLAIVPMLADLYTKQKKFGDEIVTTSQVYDMMSNKMVSYADVMKVINSITDEGGKFFDFQAKQAETMKVQINNLTLAWNNMLNEIGKNNQGLLTAPLKGLKLLFENWQMLVKAIRAAIVAMGMYYTRATLVSLINGTLITQGTIRAGYLLAAGWDAAKNALIGLRTVMITNPFGALAVAISTAIGYMTLFNDSVNEMTEYNNRFGESGGSVVRDVEALYGSIESLDKESATYKKVVAELNQILGDFNLAQIDEKSNIDEILKSREKNIQLIKEEILERKHLNDLQQGRDTYDDEVKKARERLRSNLSNAITENFFGIGTINEEIAKNAPALTNIISDIIESNIELVANKTGDEYEKGVEKIFAKIQERLKNNKALGLSEETINSSWLENNFFRFYKSNIIRNVINDLKDAKEANDQYNESVNENYEAEKRAAEQGATFNDRVEQTSDSLLKAANDTDKFYGKINQLIKDYSGQNIIDFLVRVNAQVPSWMAKMNGTELARLSARFAALASQAKKAGKEGLNINGTYFTTQQLYERAAQYASAVKQKQADTEARKSTTITKEASEALKDYKQSLEAVRVAKNRLKQGTADQTLVTEKEAEAQKKYNAALQKGVSLEDLKKAKDGKQAKTQKDPLGDALQKEIQLINDIQKTYKEYRKAGVDAETAKTAAANEYTKSLQTQNAQLKRFGIKGLTGEQLATMDLREIRDYYQSMLDIASKLKNVKGVEALEKALRGINVEIAKLDYKKITDGLNSELGKLKDEYELAIELDANPELGNLFTEMFNINTDTLPKTIKEYADKYTQYLNKYLESNHSDLRFGAGELFNLTQDDINAFQSQVSSGAFNQAWFDEIKKAYDDINGKRRKELKDIFNNTKKLEYELAELNDKIAIKEKEQALLHEKIEKEKNETTKHYLELTYQSNEKAIDELRSQALSLIPEYARVFNSITEYSAGVSRRLQRDLMRVFDEAKYDSANKKWTLTGSDGKQTILNDTQYRKEREKLTREMRKSQEPFKKIKEAFKPSDKNGVVDYAKGIELVSAEIQKLGSVASEVGNLAQIFGADEQTVEIINDVATSLNGVATAGQGISQIASGDYIGGAASVLSGITSIIGAWADNDNKRIDAEIKDSERAVKRLENAYKLLKDAADDAYGIAEVGAKRATIANKELQLAELRRQLYLEQSRKAKNRDKDKIEDLKGQIIDLELEIKNATNEIVNDLLNISSVGDVAENLVSQMIEAFKKGEDYMGKYADTFEDMIDNMIMKAIVGEVIGKKMEEIFKKVEEIAGERAKQTQVDAKDIFEGKDLELAYGWVKEYESPWWNDNHKADMPLTSLTNTYEDWKKWLEWINTRATEEGKAAYGKALENLEKIYGNLISVQPSDVEGIRDTVDNWKQGVKTEFESWMEAFGVMFGQDKESTKLSALQQGIQGVTEDTAGAIEAYMNIVSQRVFEQNLYLQEIRDHLNNFDLDVQLGTLSQMLLQLQQSYQVQQNIESILTGVLNPSGRAIVVELNS